MFRLILPVSLLLSSACGDVSDGSESNLSNVTVTVVNLSGSPTAGVPVVFHNEDGTIHSEVQSDGSGKATAPASEVDMVSVIDLDQSDVRAVHTWLTPNGAEIDATVFSGTAPEKDLDFPTGYTSGHTDTYVLASCGVAPEPVKASTTTPFTMSLRTTSECLDSDGTISVLAKAVKGDTRAYSVVTDASVGSAVEMPEFLGEDMPGVPHPTRPTKPLNVAIDSTPPNGSLSLNATIVRKGVVHDLDTAASAFATFYPAGFADAVQGRATHLDGAAIKTIIKRVPGELEAITIGSDFLVPPVVSHGAAGATWTSSEDYAGATLSQVTAMSVPWIFYIAGTDVKAVTRPQLPTAYSSFSGSSFDSSTVTITDADGLTSGTFFQKSRVDDTTWNSRTASFTAP